MTRTWILAVWIAIIAISCSAQNKSVTSASDISGHWLVKGLTTDSGTMKLDNGTNNQSMFLDIDVAAGRYSGLAVCNRIMGSISAGNNQSLKLGTGASTKMACPGMELEDLLLVLLVRTDNYQLKNDALFLRQGREDLIKLERASVKTSQLDEGMAEEKMSLGMNDWLFQKMEYNGVTTDLTSLNASLSFDETGKQLTGFTGCNRISGSFSQQAAFNSGALNLGNIISTRKACPNMSMEHQLQTKLQTVTRYQLQNHSLLLFHGDDLLFTLRWIMKK